MSGLETTASWKALFGYRVDLYFVAVIVVAAVTHKVSTESLST